MKKPLLIAIVVLLKCTATNAQTPFNTMDSININNINATVLVHGDMWWNPGSTVYEPKCFYPNGSRKNANFAAALWLSAYDAANTLHVAAQMYRIGGNDYWPGPLPFSGSISYGDSRDWAKIWKINRTDIDSFRHLTTHTVSNTPPGILTWPGAGNSHAAGFGGVSLAVGSAMAPFVDLNGNGMYEPLLGEYPDVPGDQALWWVFNDNGPAHSQSNGVPLQVEIHAMAYAYHRGTLIDNVVYYDYEVLNRSAYNYHNSRLALWDDIDLGYAFDDYFGFDSSWRMGICYNGASDDGGAAGHPANSYGPFPPHSAITMVSLPGDAGSSYVPAGSFTYYNNDHSIIGNPVTDSQFNYNMRSMRGDGHHWQNDSGVDINYVFECNPTDTSVPLECAYNNTPGDRRFVLSSNDFTLNTGASAHVVLAHIVADSAGGCPHTNFSKIRILADTAWHRYHSLATPEIKETAHVNIYPNPAHDKLYVDAVGITADDVIICSTLGQRQRVVLTRVGSEYELIIGDLSPGVYYLRCRKDDVLITNRFIKQ